MIHQRLNNGWKIVLKPTISPWQEFQPSSFTSQVLTLNENFPAFDLFNIHTYGNGDWLLNRACRTRKILDSHGFTNMPFWVTETGTPTSDRTLDTAAANVEEKYSTKTLKILRSLQAERLFWWSDWKNSLLGRDGNPTPAYFTFEERLQTARREDGFCSTDLNCDGTTNFPDLLHWRREVATQQTEERDLLGYLQLLREWFTLP